MNYENNSHYGAYVPPPVPDLVVKPTNYGLDKINLEDIKKEPLPQYIPPQPPKEVLEIYAISNARMALAEVALQNLIRKGI